MSKDVVNLIRTLGILAIGIGGALGANALGNPELGSSILGFMGGLVGGASLSSALAARKVDKE